MQHIKHHSCRVESDGVGLDAAVFSHVGQDGASPEPLQSFGAGCHLAQTTDDARKVLSSRRHLASELFMRLPSNLSAGSRVKSKWDFGRS